VAAVFPLASLYQHPASPPLPLPLVACLHPLSCHWLWLLRLLFWFLALQFRRLRLPSLLGFLQVCAFVFTLKTEAMEAAVG
jgi:hypothetical protein